MHPAAVILDRPKRLSVYYAVSSAEDPEKILDQAVEDMQNDLIRLRQAAAEVTASEKRMQAKFEQAQKTADEWYRRAELALSKNDEELAREALSRRKAFQDNANMLRSQLEQQGKAVQTIIGNMRMLESKLAEAKMKKDTLKARAQSAKSARSVNDMVAGLNTSSALGAFEKMEEKVLSLEAQAEAATLVSCLPLNALLSTCCWRRQAVSSLGEVYISYFLLFLSECSAARCPRQSGVQISGFGRQ